MAPQSASEGGLSPAPLAVDSAGGRICAGDCEGGFDGACCGDGCCGCGCGAPGLRRCTSTSSATACTWSGLTSASPSQAAQARARAQQHQVGPQAVHLGGNAQRACGLQHRVGPGQRAGRLQALACRAQLRGQRGLGVCMAGAEGGRVGIEQQPRAHDGLALGRILHIGQAHAQAQAVQQLRAQLAFLGVHGAHQHEARRVAVRDAVALDHVDAAGGGIQQHIDQASGSRLISST